MNLITKFDEHSAVEVILYLAHNSSDPTFHHISKLLYFADRLHLARYGRLICNDIYVAMKHGPVPSGVYDMLKNVANGSSYIHFTEIDNTEIGSAFNVRDGYCVVAKREPDLEWLSDSDIECLDESLRLYDSLSFDQLSHVSHHTLAWQEADQNDFISFELLARDIDDTFELDGLLLEHLNDPNP